MSLDANLAELYNVINMCLNGQNKRNIAVTRPILCFSRMQRRMSVPSQTSYRQKINQLRQRI